VDLGVQEVEVEEDNLLFNLPQRNSSNLYHRLLTSK
jgi:hypothetical protein